MVRRPRHVQGLEPHVAERRLRDLLRIALQRPQERPGRDALRILSAQPPDHRHPKGSWVLRMLRAELGEDLYRRCIKTYLERHRFGNVTTEDLRAVIEELSGRSFDQFFDQWVYHAHHPELDVRYSWDEKAKLAKLSVRQTQRLGDNVLLFNFPLTLRVKGSL